MRSRATAASHDPAAHTEDVHIVVLNSLPGRVVIVNQPCSDTRNFVCADGSADAAAADCHAAFHVPGSNRLGERDDEVGVVIARIQAVSSDIDYLVPSFAKMSNQLFL